MAHGPFLASIEASRALTMSRRRFSFASIRLTASITSSYSTWVFEKLFLRIYMRVENFLVKNNIEIVLEASD